jgi:F0F1-type ATP synthase delta subunit
VAAEPASLALPLLVISPSDVSRLARELESLHDYLHQASLRKGGEAVKLPRTSRLLDELATTNNLNLLQAGDRNQAASFLKHITKESPVVTMSFAAEPSAAFLAKVVTWLRQNVHPALLLRVGLQPTIAAGFTLRTTNKQFDFSLRKHFDEQRSVLIDKLRTAGEAK